MRRDKSGGPMQEGVLAGRVAIVTGGSMGLGFAIAEAFLNAGAHVVLCARDHLALRAARDALRANVGSDQIVLAEACDVSREADLVRLMDVATTQLPGLDILVNNAAAVGPIGPVETVDWAAWRQAVATNLLGPVQLTRLAIPHLRRRGRGKIIFVSAGGATSPDPRFSAYAASKAGIVAFAATVAEELRGDGIDVNSIAPGGLATRMNEEKLTAGPDALGQAVYDQLLERKQSGGTSPQLGAELAVQLASDATNGITGRLISAVWDDWQKLPERAAALKSSDIYTLRRIMPADRGLTWPARRS
jgi:NAD(P)-dependent dehydrogenase (short-subunit alcohol dehydrogenase family)